ncbi:MAG TPA: hypothetical protein EYP10_09205 [Armatimonadetes bacterium]|nr:hypothetical protein [Armatimonadota bacterium]
MKAKHEMIIWIICHLIALPTASEMGNYIATFGSKFGCGLARVLTDGHGWKIHLHPFKSALIRVRWRGDAIVVLFHRATIDATGFLVGG